VNLGARTRCPWVGQLGHASITTTMDRYGHLFDGHDTGLLAAHDAADSPATNVTLMRQGQVGA
jgi:hypothetical protein